MFLAAARRASRPKRLTALRLAAQAAQGASARDPIFLPRAPALALAPRRWRSGEAPPRAPAAGDLGGPTFTSGDGAPIATKQVGGGGKVRAARLKWLRASQCPPFSLPAALRARFCAILRHLRPCYLRWAWEDRAGAWGGLHPPRNSPVVPTATQKVRPRGASRFGRTRDACWRGGRGGGASIPKAPLSWPGGGGFGPGGRQGGGGALLERDCRVALFRVVWRCFVVSSRVRLHFRR